jgi:4,5-DOPA dioxygenase extradiol
MSALPALFISHGSPMFAVEPGIAGRELAALAARLARPAAIIVASPHWMSASLSVTASLHPETIHDFGGFPPQLYKLKYPAPGSAEWSARAIKAFAAAGVEARAELDRGLDHGVWVPLMHMYPQADVPVIQVSLDPRHSARDQFELGRALAPLREAGALIIGSGSLTHNLYEWRGGETGPQRYVVEFAEWIAQTLATDDIEALLDYRRRAPHAERAHPTDEHLLPLMFARGAAGDRAAVSRIAADDVRYGMLAMDAYVFGAAA